MPHNARHVVTNLRSSLQLTSSRCPTSSKTTRQAPNATAFGPGLWVRQLAETSEALVLTSLSGATVVALHVRMMTIAYLSLARLPTKARRTSKLCGCNCQVLLPKQVVCAAVAAAMVATTAGPTVVPAVADVARWSLALRFTKFLDAELHLVNFGLKARCHVANLVTALVGPFALFVFLSFQLAQGPAKAAAHSRSRCVACL